MLSESRADAACAKPGKSGGQEVFQRWGVETAAIGRVTADGRFRLLHQGEVVADIPVKALTDLVPIRQRRGAEPERFRALKTAGLSDYKLQQPAAEVLLRLLASPNIASKAWFYHQYDHGLGGDTVVGPGGCSRGQVPGTRGTA